MKCSCGEYLFEIKIKDTHLISICTNCKKEKIWN